MVAYELLRGLLEYVFTALGVEGLAIGGLTAGLIGIYYIREVAGVLVIVARYARVLSIIGLVLLVLLVGGSTLGVLELDGLGSIGSQIMEVL